MRRLLAAVAVVLLLAGCGDAASPRTTVDPATLLQFSELEGYSIGNRVERNLLIKPGASRDQLVEFARALFARYPRVRFQLWDDDEKFKQYMLWDIHYIDEPNPYAYPEAWVEEHLVGDIQPMLSSSRGGAVWQFWLDAYGVDTIDLE